MKLFYDLRLGYLVTAPGQETALTDLAGKAGDGDEVIVQFGRSSDPTGTASIVAAQTWTPENLPGGTVITVGIKEDGDYSDGALLASNSTWTHDAVAFTYTGAISYNTTAINTALLRLDTNAGNDIALVECGFEITFQPGGSGPWRSSIYPIGLTLYHDILGGSEGTPTDADDPDEYLLKAAGIEWLPTVTSKTGGTSSDLDAIPTPDRSLNTLVAFRDADGSPAVLRLYRLESGTDAESSPNIIRPDDYESSTNERIWKQQIFNESAFSNPMTTAGDIIIGGTGGTPARLAAGTNGHVLTMVSGSPAYAAGTPPYPLGGEPPRTTTADIVNGSANNGQLYRVDTTSGNVDLSLRLQSVRPYEANFYFFALKIASANASQIVPESGVNINGVNSPITLTHNVPVRLWRGLENEWFTF